MKMRWQLLNRDTRRGTQKRKGRGETPTPTHLAQSGQTLKGQGKRKSGRTTGQTPTRGGGWAEAPDTTYKARAKPTSAREGPKPDLERERHEIGDQWGASWWTLMHPQCNAGSPDQPQWPKFHVNPMDSLRIQPSNWCTIEPHQINQKESGRTCKACPEAWTSSCCACWHKLIIHSSKKLKTRLHGNRHDFHIQGSKMVSPWNSGQQFNQNDVRRVRLEKRPTVSLY